MNKSFKYLRERGMYEKVDERDALSRYQVTPVDTKWIDTIKAFEEGPMQIRSRLAAREFKCGDRLVCGDSSAGSVESHTIHRSERTTSKHSQSCTSTCHVRIFTQMLGDLCWHVCQWENSVNSTRACMSHVTQQATSTGWARNTSGV